MYDFYWVLARIKEKRSIVCFFLFLPSAPCMTVRAWEKAISTAKLSTADRKILDNWPSVVLKEVLMEHVKILQFKRLRWNYIKYYESTEPEKHVRIQLIAASALEAMQTHLPLQKPILTHVVAQMGQNRPSTEVRFSSEPGDKF